MENRISPKLSEVLNYGKEEAQRLRSRCVEPAHLMLALLRDGDSAVTGILNQFGVNLGHLKWMLEDIVRGDEGEADPLLSNAASRIIKLTMLEARSMQAEWADCEHLLLALLRDEKEPACKALNEEHVDYPAVKSALTQKQNPQSGFGFTEDEDDEEEDDEDIHDSGRPGHPSSAPSAAARKRVSNGGDKGTPALDTFGTDLTKAAQEGLPCSGHSRDATTCAAW